jgi:hypothetical protein
MAEKQGETWVEGIPSGAAEPIREKSKQEKRLLLKMDLSIVPLLACSFFIAYMVRPLFPFSSKTANFKKDRNNLGNARIMGMQEDLHLSDEQFFNCLMMFCELLPNKPLDRIVPFKSNSISRGIYGIHASRESRNASYWPTASAWDRGHILWCLWDLPGGCEKLCRCHGAAGSDWHRRSLCPSWVALFQFLVQERRSRNTSRYITLQKKHKLL